ncbi:hypothetical protein RSAG8_08022, partial [Rhizoctonia solani AG-8 WAC10335]
MELADNAVVRVTNARRPRWRRGIAKLRTGGYKWEYGRTCYRPAYGAQKKPSGVDRNAS